MSLNSADYEGGRDLHLSLIFHSNNLVVLVCMVMDMVLLVVNTLG